MVSGSVKVEEHGEGCADAHGEQRGVEKVNKELLHGLILRKK
jgi:hypothetical protein